MSSAKIEQKYKRDRELLMSGFGDKIEEFLKNGMEDIFGTIGILGFIASVPLSILISLIFGIDWAVNIIMGFWLIYVSHHISYYCVWNNVLRALHNIFCMVARRLA